MHRWVGVHALCQPEKLNLVCDSQTWPFGDHGKMLGPDESLYILGVTDTIRLGRCSGVALVCGATWTCDKDWMPWFDPPQGQRSRRCPQCL